MSWQAVARKDFRDAVQSRALWGLSVVFVLLSLLISVVYATVEEVGGANASPKGLAFFLASILGTFVSLAAIVTCYRSLAGERESGSVKILMALPHTRFDVVLGKLVGRTGVLALPAVGGLLVGTLVGWALLGAAAPVATLALVAVSLLFVLSYVGIMVGLSAFTGSTTRAATLTVGFFVVVELAWDVVALSLAFVANGFVFPQTAADYPSWLFLVNQVPPSSSFVTSLSALLPDVASAAGGGGTGPGAGQIDAVFATPWVGVVALVFWTVVPIAIGYRRFAAADL
ncbi:ABC transporter permease [Halobacteriales archaeon Cl-PHB]